jgi:hypothetical protein
MEKNKVGTRETANKACQCYKGNRDVLEVEQVRQSDSQAVQSISSC